MSTQIDDALAALGITNKAAQAANQEYADTAQQNAIAARKQAQELLDATIKKGEVQQNLDTTIAEDAKNQAATQNFINGNKALASDSSLLVQEYADEVHKYAVGRQGGNNGGVLNEFIRGLTGRDLQLERLQLQGKALTDVTGKLGELAQAASATDITTKQLDTTQAQPQLTAQQNRIDQANVALKAGQEQVNAAAQVAQAGAAQAGEAKNMFAALIQFRNANSAERNNELQNQLLKLDIQEKTRQANNAAQDDAYLDSLAASLNVPKPALKAQGPEVIQALSSIAAGIPVVNNLSDPKQVDLAQRVSAALPDPVQRVTSPYVGTQLLAYQQELNTIQQSALTAGKTVEQTAKNANFKIVSDVKNNFLDTVPVQIPGETHAAPIVNTIGSWYLNPAGSKGQVLWNSPQVKQYIASGAPGAKLAQKVFNDAKTNPAILKDGININYLQANADSPAAAFDFYKFVQHQVILSSPWSVYGLAPPKAEIPLHMTTLQQDIFGGSYAKNVQIIPKTDVDIEKAFVQIQANKKAADFAAKNNKVLYDPAL